MKRIIDLLIITTVVLLSGCKDDKSLDEPEKPTEGKSVIVVLPMGNGMQTQWERTFTLFAHNSAMAFSNQDEALSLKFEYHDENSENLRELARTFLARDDVYAVIGGLYSASAAELAAVLCPNQVPFFTLATCEELVRAYSDTGYLWAMTETDITQCEVLLSKVTNYGGKSVALIAKDDNMYGKTFIDWFGFQAKELGLENKGIFTYTSQGVSQVASEASKCGADYVICAASEIEDIPAVAKVFRNTTDAPRLLFSDTGYGTDVIDKGGFDVEGIEGVCFGADPESGYEVSYETFFGEPATVGSAQAYDAAMLILYAAWHQKFHGDSTMKALREVVSGGDFNMGSWMGEDMRNVVDAMARGDKPKVRGASGALNFDSKVFTNVLATVYYNYKLYGGRYIILDYNTADGGNRTDATLAGWNWKASHMQDFNNGTAITYPAHTGNKALLVASSSGWSNYRHQADVLSIYRLLKSSGYSDDDIILIMEDDIAMNPSNPDPGSVKGKPGGENLYQDVNVDYTMSDLSPDDIYSILKGEKSERLPIVFDSNGEGDNVFIFWSGHGEPGAMCWGNLSHAIVGEGLRSTLTQMAHDRSYRKILMMVEACFSGGVMEQCEGLPGILFITAANKDETSKADIFSEELNVWMSNRFTSTFIEQITANHSISMRDMYYRLFINTVGSHVMVYNANLFDNLYSSDMSEFIMCKHK